jgi:hypothetical protein
VWNTFTRVTTLDFATEVISEYRAGDAPDSDTLAYVYQERDPEHWVLAANLATSDDPTQLIATLVHEYAHILTLATLAGQLSVFLVLLASLRALGVDSAEVSVVEAFAGWSLARLLGSIPITPGGLGVVELGMTTALTGFGGNNAGVVAAVLVYRFLTIVPTLVLGGVAAGTWRRHRPAAPASADQVLRAPDDQRDGDDHQHNERDGA